MEEEPVRSKASTSTLALLFFVGLYLALVTELVADLLSRLINSLNLAPQIQFGVALILCAPAPPLSLKIKEREESIPQLVKQVVNWVAAVFLATGVILVSTGVLGWHVLYSRLLYGVLLVLFAPALWSSFKGRDTSVPGIVSWTSAVSFVGGTILVFAGVLRWPVMTIVGLMILATVIVSILGVRKTWWSIPLRIPEPALERMVRWATRIRTVLQSLSEFIRAVTSHRLARLAMLLVISAVLLSVVVVLRHEILRGLNAFVSGMSSFRQIAREYESQIVFATLGLASFAVLLAVLITIVYERYSRQLTLIILAIAFVALALFFCIYTAPAVVTGTADLILSTRTPTATSTATPTNTPTFSPTPTASLTATPASTMTSTPTPPSWPSLTSTQTPTQPRPTPSSPAQPSSTRPSLTPTKPPPPTNTVTPVEPPPPTNTKLPPPTNTKAPPPTNTKPSP